MTHLIRGLRDTAYNTISGACATAKEKTCQIASKTTTSVKNFVANHPGLIRAGTFVAVTGATYLADFYFTKWATSPSSLKKIECEDSLSCDEIGCLGSSQFSCDLPGYMGKSIWISGNQNGTFTTREIFSKCEYVKDCLAHSSLNIENIVDTIQDKIKEAPAMMGGAALATAYGLTRLMKKTASLVNHAFSSPEDKTNAWLSAAKGFAYYPLVKAAGHASALVGAVANRDILTGFIRAYSEKVPLDVLPVVLPQVLHTSTVGVAYEEFVYRIFTQDLILKKGLSAVLKLCSPRLAELNQTHPVAKAIRIALSSAVFSQAQLANLAVLPWPNVAYQLANTFGAGVIFGHLQEQTGNGWASLGAHLALNMGGVLGFAHRHIA